LSHAFIEREIRALEQLGVEVVPFSVRLCPPEQLLSEEMRWDAARTTALKTTKLSLGLLAFADLLFRAPSALLKGLLQALRTGVATPRARLWQLFYLAEAVLLVKLARQRGVRHFHVHFANNGADIARRAVAVGCAADGLGAWTWSLAMHGPTEFEDPERFDLVAKADDASFVACISEYVVDELRWLGASSQKLSVVHMGVDVDRFPGLSAERAARPTGPLRVLFVGRLVREKAPGVLLEAVSRLRQSGRDVEAAIVGGGELADELAQEMEQRGLRECVQLLGPRGQEELPDWYAWADVFCLPSLAEGVPVVLMEAMASELPVVTTRIAGIPELVRDGETGLLVDPDDATRVVDRLARLDDDPDLRAVLGRAGRQLVIEAYTPGANARLLRGLLQQVGD